MADSRDINIDEMRRRARRRLVGAVVLALAAAVIVPMLLESDPKPVGEDVSVRIPPVDEGKFVNRLADKGKGGTAKGEPMRESAKVEQSSKAEPAAAPGNMPPPRKTVSLAEQKVLSAPGAGSAAPVTATPLPAAAKSTTATPAAPVTVIPPTAAPAPQAPPPASPAMQAPPAASPATSAAGAVPGSPPAVPADAAAAGFSVQLAAFSDDKGANALANKLKNAGYPAYTEALSTSKGTLWRVRVGPYPAREDALDIRNKLKAEGYSGIVAAK